MMPPISLPVFGEQQVQHCIRPGWAVCSLALGVIFVSAASWIAYSSPFTFQADIRVFEIPH